MNSPLSIFLPLMTRPKHKESTRMDSWSVCLKSTSGGKSSGIVLSPISSMVLNFISFLELTFQILIRTMELVYIKYIMEPIHTFKQSAKLLVFFNTLIITTKLRCMDLEHNSHRTIAVLVNALHSMGTILTLLWWEESIRSLNCIFKIWKKTSCMDQPNFQK